MFSACITCLTPLLISPMSACKPTVSFRRLTACQTVKHLTDKQWKLLVSSRFCLLRQKMILLPQLNLPLARKVTVASFPLQFPASQWLIAPKFRHKSSSALSSAFCRESIPARTGQVYKEYIYMWNVYTYINISYVCF